ncbi:MAG: hypothetical protein EP338_01930 [Bacteroidetes bacterium]|nr:MAG: hypothetical protein EP338_01930 [Bacteroidota bacterium]
MKAGIFVLGVFLAACSSGSKADICQCLDAGKTFNELNQKVLDQSISPREYKDLKRAKSTKDSLCQPFKNMSGDQMRELQQECSDNSL